MLLSEIKGKLIKLEKTLNDRTLDNNEIAELFKLSGILLRELQNQNKKINYLKQRDKKLKLWESEQESIIKG